MKRNTGLLSVILLAVLAFGGITHAFAQEERGESEKTLRREAKITMKQARATALAQVPGGQVESGELERENGKLIYSFDIRARNHSLKEVQVDAVTGALVEVKTESPNDEAKEKKQESKERHP
jgi:uncharacterized membrane protein YkoI